MDGAVLNELYVRYHRALYLYVYSLCQDEALAQDLVQETFLKALLSLPESHGNLRAWLYLVARNLYFNHRKRAGREVPADRAETAEAGEGPLEALLTDERTRLLYEALGRLEERKREVLQMQYFGGLSQKEIAAVLRLNPEHVRVLSYRGRREIRQWMEEHGYDLS